MFVSETDYLHIWVDEDVQLMYSEWLRSASSEEYRQGNKRLLAVQQKYSLPFWIADSARLGDISAEDLEWTVKELTPRVIGANIKKLARVSGEDRISYNKFEHFVEKMSRLGFGDMEVRQFTSYKEAADWIGEIYS
ncbi:MAG: hypothetical protein LPK07_11750 [Hymenobacteraceae bacterium]|nr:hypothetical protein [Hymenobacteraceae bacterium]